MTRLGVVARLAASPRAAVVRVHGKPREPVEGRHRYVVVYAAPTLTALEVAGILRELAEQLEARGADE